MIELAAGGEEAGVMGEAIAAAQDIPLRFVESILAEVRHAGLVEGRHGTDGAYWLTRPADQITLADVIRAVEGPLASVRGESADELAYPGDAKPLQEVWIALRASITQLLEAVTLADLVSGDLPEPIGRTVGEHQRVGRRRLLGTRRDPVPARGPAGMAPGADRARLAPPGALVPAPPAPHALAQRRHGRLL